MTGPGQPQSFLHYDPIRVDYSVTEAELRELQQASGTHWKDLTIACTGVGLSCALNAVAIISGQADFKVTLALFLNALFGLVGIALGIAFGVAWYRAAKAATDIVGQIKGKPRNALNFPSTQAGAAVNPTATLAAIPVAPPTPNQQAAGATGSAASPPEQGS